MWLQQRALRVRLLHVTSQLCWESGECLRSAAGRVLNIRALAKVLAGVRLAGLVGGFGGGASKTAAGAGSFMLAAAAAKQKQVATSKQNDMAGMVANLKVRVATVAVSRPSRPTAARLQQQRQQ